MKLALCYTVFNGLELLEQSIKAMIKEVDLIILCYQETSNKGNKCKQVKPFCEYLADKYKDKIHLDRYDPSEIATTKENERQKHTQLMNEAKRLHASHYILAATDHFYTVDHIRYAKRKAIELDFDVSVTRMFTYYKEPIWQLEPPEEYFMPFISKLHRSTLFTRRVSYPVVVDPSVKVNTSSVIHEFSIDDCVLHHFSMIRKDIKDKFKNAASSVNWTPEQVNRFVLEYNCAKIGDPISYFKGRKIIQVKNIFDL